MLSYRSKVWEHGGYRSNGQEESRWTNGWVWVKKDEGADRLTTIRYVRYTVS